MTEQQIAGLIALALNKWTLFTAGGIFLILRTLSALEWLNRSQAYRRFLPLLPEALGMAAAFCGGIPIVDSEPYPLKIAAGVWCAYIAKNFRKILGQSLLGDDKQIKGRKSVAQVAAEELGEVATGDPNDQSPSDRP